MFSARGRGGRRRGGRRSDSLATNAASCGGRGFRRKESKVKEPKRSRQTFDQTMLTFDDKRLLLDSRTDLPGMFLLTRNIEHDVQEPNDISQTDNMSPTKDAAELLHSDPTSRELTRLLMTSLVTMTVLAVLYRLG